MRRITFSLATIAVSACFAAAANAYPDSITKATTTSNVTEIDWPVTLAVGGRVIVSVGARMMLLS